MQLYVHEEMVDMGPQFLATTSLFREIRPKYVLSFGNTADDFINVLIDTVTTGGDSTVTSDGLRTLPENFYLLSTKEYSKFIICGYLRTEKRIFSRFDLFQVTKYVKPLFPN